MLIRPITVNNVLFGITFDAMLVKNENNLIGYEFVDQPSDSRYGHPSIAITRSKGEWYLVPRLMRDKRFELKGPFVSWEEAMLTAELLGGIKKTFAM